jgi:O-antigen/teichoic acid export membrane protein
MIWISVMGAFGSLGVKDALVFYTAKDELNDQLVPNMLFLGFAQSAVLMGMGLAAFPLFMTRQDPLTLQNLRLYLWVIPLNLLGQYCIAMAQGSLRIAFFNVMRFLIPFSNLVVASSLFFLNMPSVRLVLIGQLIGNGLVTGIYLARTIWVYPARWRLSTPLLKGLLGYGIRSHLGTVMHSLNQRLDQMLISLILPPSMLGYYVVATTAAGVIGVIPNAFRTVLFPSAAGAKDLEQSKGIIRSFFMRNLILVVACSAVLLLLFPILIPLVYGEAFTPSVFPGQILLAAIVFASMRDVLSYAHRALNNPLVAAKSELLGLVATGLALLLLLPSLGIIGAAIASLIAYGVSAVYNVYMMKKLYAFGPGALFQLRRVSSPFNRQP